MTAYFKLAWRNLWRNKRRTGITLTSICFAMFFGLLMKSVLQGTYASLDDAMIKNSTGYIQIQHPNFWDDKNIDYTFEQTDELTEIIDQTSGLSNRAPKLSYFALASSGVVTKGVSVIGTDAETERFMSNMDEKVVEGSYLSDIRGAALVPENLAEYLELQIGDTFVLFGQGYHGVTAAGKFWMEGKIDFKIPLMNNSLIYVHLEDAQELFGAYNRLTELALMIDEPRELLTIQESIKERVDTSEFRVMNWREMNDDYVQMADSKNISSGIMIGILYLIVGFGIFGTLFMMTLERRREFSVMIAIGLRRKKLAIVVFIESLLMGIIGGISGVVVSVPLIAYFHKNPIPLSGDLAEMYATMGIEPEYHFAFESEFILYQFLIVFVMCVFLTVVPILSVFNLNFVKALRGR